MALAYLNRPSEALRMVEQLRLELPFFTCAFARKMFFYLKRSEQLARYLKGLDAPTRLSFLVPRI